MHTINNSKWWFLFLLICISFSLSGQNVAKLYKKGMKTFYNEDFTSAQKFFEEIENTGRSYKDSEYRLEISKLVQRKYRGESLESILKYRDTKMKSDKFYHYWMGRIFANKYMFPEAVDSWNKFLNLKVFKSEEITSETQKFLEKAKVLVSYFDYTDEYEIHQLESPINTEFAELSPAYFANSYELLFASNRDSENNNFTIYHSINEDGTWKNTTPVNTLGEFKRKNANVEVVNEDGKFFIFKKKKGGDLYFSEKSDEGWTIPTEFDSKITSTKLKSHFFINEHEDRIIFSTHKRRKALDLMESFKNPETGKWEKPHPLGPTINTIYNEDSPFLSKDESKLYFCSDREGGVGELDVYVSEFDSESKTWSEPVNLGWPINSPDDEFHFKMNPDGKSGYFSSNRIHSKGDFDIFYFWKIEKTSIEGKIIHAITNQPINYGEIRFLPKQYTDEYFRSPIDSSGNYHMNIISNEVFEVKIIQDIDTIHMELFEIHDAKGESIKHFKDFYVYPLDVPESIRDSIQLALAQKAGNLQDKPSIKVSQKEDITSDTSDSGPVMASTKQMVTKDKKSNPKPGEVVLYKDRNVVLRNIYFDFGKSTLTPASNPKLIQLKEYLESHPNTRIEISGHTDNVGPTQVNLILSKNRADAVKNWLTEKGIDKQRVVTKGYGEERPMATNDDEIEGRSLNRRIEIKLIQ